MTFLWSRCTGSAPRIRRPGCSTTPASLRTTGAFALTEPDHGSDVAGGMETRARRVSGGSGRLLGSQRRQTLDRQRDVLRLHARVGAGRSRRRHPGLHRGRRPARHQPQPDRTQDRPADGAERGHCFPGRAGGRGGPLRRDRELRGHQRTAARVPDHGGVAGGGPAAGGVRRRPAARRRTPAVRAAAGQIPAHPAAAGRPCSATPLRAWA